MVIIYFDVGILTNRGDELYGKRECFSEIL